MMKTLYLSILSLASVLCCLPTIQAENPVGRVLKANNSAVRYTGRTQVQPDGSVSFDWVGTYLETAFTGGAISLQLSETGTSYYNVFVDGNCIG